MLRCNHGNQEYNVTMVRNTIFHCDTVATKTASHNVPIVSRNTLYIITIVTNATLYNVTIVTKTNIVQYNHGNRYYILYLIIGSQNDI